jgi:hypothetical protein
MSDMSINNTIDQIQFFKKFITDYSKNQLSKDNYINIEKMNKKNFDIYLSEISEKMNKYKINDQIKKTFFDLLKEMYDSVKNDKKKFIKSENYISAKNDIDLLINGKTDIKKKYIFYMDKMENIFIKYKLNTNQIYNLVKYFNEKNDISKREQLVLNLKRSIKKMNDITKILKELKKKKEKNYLKFLL